MGRCDGRKGDLVWLLWRMWWEGGRRGGWARGNGRCCSGLRNGCFDVPISSGTRNPATWNAESAKGRRKNAGMEACCTYLLRAHARKTLRTRKSSASIHHRLPASTLRLHLHLLSTALPPNHIANPTPVNTGVTTTDAPTNSPWSKKPTILPSR